MRFAVRSERAIGIKVFEDLRESPEPLGISAPRIAACGMIERALADADELCYLRMMAVRVNAANLPYRELRRARGLREPHWPRYALVSPAMVPSVGFAALRRDQAVADLAGSQTALEIELFRSRFGRYPATSDETSARSLRARFGRIRSAASRWSTGSGAGATCCTSIGPDLKDDGGVPAIPCPEGLAEIFSGSAEQILDTPAS